MQNGNEGPVVDVGVAPAVVEEAKRTRSVGVLRACLVFPPDAYLVLPNSPEFATVDEWEKWVRVNAVDGVTYGWIRVGKSIRFATKREVLA